MRNLTAALCLLLPATAMATEWQDSHAVSQLFRKAGVQGTFVMFDTATGRFSGHNLERAQERFIPASTFKIPNTLIGLACASVRHVDEILPYGGEPQPFPQWEADMSLREAIKVSNVPVYQELARRTGLARMRIHVERLAYGNQDIGEVVDRFWLDGPLEISAVEQTEFLAELALDELPYHPDLLAEVREIVLLEQDAEYALYGKTGWGMSTEPDIGWWVGWVEKDDRVYSFALNMDISGEEMLDKRLELGKASLEALGIL